MVIEHWTILYSEFIARRISFESRIKGFEQSSQLNLPGHDGEILKWQFGLLDTWWRPQLDIPELIGLLNQSLVQEKIQRFCLVDVTDHHLRTSLSIKWAVFCSVKTGS